MSARDDVLRRLGALVNQNQALAVPEVLEAEPVPEVLEAEPVPEVPKAEPAPEAPEAQRAPSEHYSVVVPFTPEAQQKASAGNETTGDNALGDGVRDLVKPLVKAWLTSNLAQSLDDSIHEAVKPLLTGWMDANLPRIVDAATNELFKPLLTQWLDRNLAPAVERSAQREIARLIGKLPNA